MVTLMSESTKWLVGIGLGVVVIAVAAVIVITIVLLATRIARQAKTAEGAVEVVRAQTAELGGIARINDSGVRILHAARALRKVAVGQMTAARRSPPTATGRSPSSSASSRRWSSPACWPCWSQTVASIERSVDGLLESRPQVAANTANIPQLEATAPVLGLIVEEAVVQDGYMNALTDGFGGA